MNVYQFSVKKADGGILPLEELKGRLILIVNTASRCGFTHQYEDLETLYEKYRDSGLEILAFPCNQFAQQEPDSNQQIQEFCTVNYGITFPVLAKIEVNGSGADPLFRYLTENTEFKGFDFSHPLGKKLDEILSEQNSQYGLTSDIKWNFTKFLIGKDGEMIARFEPTTGIDAVEDMIKERI